MSLQDKLDAYKAEFATKRPPEIRAVMAKATADLTETGQHLRALKVGDTAPSFTLPGPDGTMVSSAEVLSRGPMVMTFYRGVWCPYCNMELQALEGIAAEIRDLGATLVALSPESAANNRKSIRQNELSFPILTDHGNAVADAFGIRFALPPELIAVYKGIGNDLTMVNGDSSWTLPMPARYVVGTDGTILFAEINPDYTRRPDAEIVLPALREAAAKRAA